VSVAIQVEDLEALPQESSRLDSVHLRRSSINTEFETSVKSSA